MSFGGFVDDVQRRLRNGEWVGQDEIEELRINGYTVTPYNTIVKDVVDMREVLNPEAYYKQLEIDINNSKNDAEFIKRVNSFARGLTLPGGPTYPENTARAILSDASKKGMTWLEWSQWIKSQSDNDAYLLGQKLRPYAEIFSQGLNAFLLSLAIFSPLIGANLEFSLAISAFRAVNNMVNYAWNYGEISGMEGDKSKGTTGYIGTYEIRYWRYHVNDGTVDGNVSNRDGWIKSRFGDYYIRKNLRYPGSQTWYDEKYKS